MGTLWLIGMMGSGKSTVGPLVAGRLGVPFVDLDHEIESATGRSVRQLFTEGEEEFRAAESAAVAKVAGAQAVVACGGGVVLDTSNVDRMRSNGTVVWLDAPVDVLTARVGEAGDRPMLDGDAPSRLGSLAAARIELYRKAADLRIDASGEDPDAIAEAVVATCTRSS